MDAQLRKDIADEFHGEYYEAAKAEKSGFWKKLDAFNDKADAFFSKYGLSAPGVELFGAVMLTIAAPPVGIVALGAWATNMGLTIYSSITSHASATKAVEADIDNGTLPARYNDVLDARLKGLSEKADLYTAQKSQLPPKGAASDSFAAATAGATAEVADAPAPAPQPNTAPKV